MKAVIQFDIDGVLADYVKGFCRLSNSVFMGTLNGSDQDSARYGTEHLVGTAVAEILWGYILRSSRFWAELPASVGLDTFRRINELQYDGHAVYFVTNRMGIEPKAQTYRWLRQHGIDSPTVVISARKGEFARAVRATHSIEDKAGNATHIAYHTEGATASYLLDRPYNRFPHEALGSKVTRVNSVTEFLDRVEEGV